MMTDFLGKKRKGPEILPAKCRRSTQLGLVWSHLSLKEFSRMKKKCKEDSVTKAVSLFKRVVNGIATAPPCGSLGNEPSGRGLKRKIGCIDMSMRMSRKRNIDKDYSLGESIGKGKFGSVVLYRNKVTGEEFACKTLVKGKEIVHSEVEIMQHLSGHPGIVMLKAVYGTRECFHLVMELCSNGRLLDEMIREVRFSEQQAAIIIRDLVSAIKHCHEMGVVHRDIKPENILLTAAGKIKLVDFGFAARISNGQSLSRVVGTPAYVAPEVLIGSYSEKADIWSAGVILFALLVGMLPFHGSLLKDVLESIKRTTLDFDSGGWEHISQPCRDLVAKMLTRDVFARLTAVEVLRHPWISLHTVPAHDQKQKPNSIIRNANRTQQSHIVMTAMPYKRTRNFVDDLKCDPSAEISSNLTHDSAKLDFSLVVDALTMAIANIGISDSKRTELYGSTASTGNVQQHCSSNFKANLCKAF